MKTTPAPADLQRWSEEVARDPGSPAFVPLADTYRRQGKREVALRLCLRGLERNPTNTEAHALLARLYLETGEREKAFDEWGMILRLDGNHFEANRGMGFVHLERGDFGTARRHLEKAAARRPNDVAVQEALKVLAERLGSAPGPTTSHVDAPGAGAAPAAAPAPSAPQPAAAAAPPESRTAAPAPTHAAAPSPSVAASPAPEAADTVTRDPSRLFDALKREPPYLGALVMDAQGLVLAGGLAEERVGGAEALGALLGGAVDEASRTAELLRLGGWRGLLLETERAQIHVTPIGDELMVLLAARAEAPAGWVLRTAARATELGRSYVEQTS